jgi:hypothetical protein
VPFAISKNNRIQDADDWDGIPLAGAVMVYDGTLGKFVQVPSFTYNPSTKKLRITSDGTVSALQIDYTGSGTSAMDVSGGHLHMQGGKGCLTTEGGFESFGLGTMDDQEAGGNSESIRLSWESSNSAYSLFTNKTGTGQFRDILLRSGLSGGLRIKPDGSVEHLAGLVVGTPAATGPAPFKVQVDDNGVGCLVSYTTTEYMEIVASSLEKGILGFGNTPLVLSNQNDIVIASDTGNINLRDQSVPQVLRSYKKYVDDSNYTRLSFGYSAGRAAYQIAVENAGTEFISELWIFTPGNLLLGTTGGSWYLNSAGHFMPNSVGVQNIGSAANPTGAVYAMAITLGSDYPDNIGLVEIKHKPDTLSGLILNNLDMGTKTLIQSYSGGDLLLRTGSSFTNYAGLVLQRLTSPNDGATFNFLAGAVTIRTASNVLLHEFSTTTPAYHRAYTSYIDDSNKSWVELSGLGPNSIPALRCVGMGTVASGTALEISSGIASDLYLSVSHAIKWRVEGLSGNFLPSADNTYDIGSSSSHVRVIYANEVRVASGWRIFQNGGESRLDASAGQSFTFNGSGNLMTFAPNYGASGTVGIGDTAGYPYMQLRTGGGGLLGYVGGFSGPLEFRSYNSYGDVNNNEDGFVRWAANVFTIGTEKAGTGTVRDWVLSRGGVEGIRQSASGIQMTETFIDVNNAINSTWMHFTGTGSPYGRFYIDTYAMTWEAGFNFAFMPGTAISQGCVTFGYNDGTSAPPYRIGIQTVLGQDALHLFNHIHDLKAQIDEKGNYSVYYDHTDNSNYSRVNYGFDGDFGSFVISVDTVGTGAANTFTIIVNNFQRVYCDPVQTILQGNLSAAINVGDSVRISNNSGAITDFVLDYNTGVVISRSNTSTGPALTIVGLPSTTIPAFRVQTTAANDDPTVDWYQVRDTTVSATPKAIWVFATVTDTVYLISFRVVARRTGGTAGANGDSAVYERVCKVKNVGGTATVATIAATVTIEDQAAWDVTLTASGANISLTVTGAANNNITWHVPDLEVSPINT